MGCRIGLHAAFAWAEMVCTTAGKPSPSRYTGSMVGSAAKHAAIALAVLLTASPAFSAQSAAQPAAKSTAKSVAKPDFSGTWERYPDPYGEGAIPDDPPPPGGGPTLNEPYASEYKDLLRRKMEADKKGEPIVDPSTQCQPEGMPTIMAAVHPIEVLQTPKQLVILAEFLTQTRRIYLNEKMPPMDEILPGYNGYSVGHWEGKTLVVKTRGVREDVKFLRIPHSDQMVITERWRRTGPDLMENEIIIEDPQYLAKPYQFTFGYKRNPEYRIMEYICDNNRYSAGSDGTMKLDVDTSK